MSLATHFAGTIELAQHDFGFPQRPPRSTPHPQVRAKQRAADWRRQLARALEYMLGKSPEQTEVLLAEMEQREREGPDFMRQRPGSIVTEAPPVNLDRNELARLAVRFRALCRNSWKTKAPGKHGGAFARTAEETFLALLYLARKYSRVFPSLEGLAYLARCCKSSVVSALTQLETLGWITRIRRLKEVDTALGFKTVQTTNAYLIHEPTSGLGLIAIRMFIPESNSWSASEAYDSSLEYGERYKRWLDADSPLGQALSKLGKAIMREN